MSEAGTTGSSVHDVVSRAWVERLRPGNPCREETAAKLHEILVRVAFHELSRRRTPLRSISGPELDDLAHQAANDALMSILGKLDEFRGLSRFTTWTYKFVVFEVSNKVARHTWRRYPPSTEELDWDSLPDLLSPQPDASLQEREQLDLLAREITDLTERQREVFVAVALNNVPIDVLALQLGSNRNAIYKNLFDARRRLRDRLAANGYPVLGEDAA